MSVFGGSDNSIKPGMVIAYGGSGVLDGYLLCDGAAISRTTYANLFAAIGTTYGAGDGSTTFNIPNGDILCSRDIADNGYRPTDGKGTYLVQLLTNGTTKSARLRNSTAASGQWSADLNAEGLNEGQYQRPVYLDPAHQIGLVQTNLPNKKLNSYIKY